MNIWNIFLISNNQFISLIYLLIFDNLLVITMGRNFVSWTSSFEKPKCISWMKSFYASVLPYIKKFIEYHPLMFYTLVLGGKNVVQQNKFINKVLV